MDSDPNIQNSPGGGNAIVQVIRFLLRLALAAILVLALVSLMWFGWQQLDRWMDRMSRRTVILESDTDYLLDQMATSQAQIALLTTRLASGQELAAAQGSTIISQVEAQQSAVQQLEELVSSEDILSDTLSILVEGVAALQRDVNENMSQIDQIGGQADAAIIRSGTLETQLATLEAIAGEPGEQVIQLKEAVRWLHLWQLVSNARLRLAENNPGLAALDVEQAFLTASSIRVEILEEEGEAYSGVADRLELALSNLPDDPGSAARDLESAWEAIEQILVELLGIEVVQVEIEELETLNGTAEPTDAGVGNGGRETAVTETAVSVTGGTPTAVPGTPEASPTPDE
jgi:hypothetical protein